MKAKVVRGLVLISIVAVAVLLGYFLVSVPGSGSSPAILDPGPSSPRNAIQSGGTASRQKVRVQRAEAGPAAEEHLALRGIVRQEDESPAPGARVRAVWKASQERELMPEECKVFTATCGEDGRFGFAALPPGSYDLLAALEETAGDAASVSLGPAGNPHAEHEVAIYLSPAFSLHGLVTGPGEKPVAGALVVMVDNGSIAQTDREGRFVLDHLTRLGLGTLRVSAPGLAVVRELVLVRPGRFEHLHLEEGASLCGTVRLEGRPMAGIRVTAWEEEEGDPTYNFESYIKHFICEAVSGRDGKYRIDRLPRGAIWLGIFEERYTASCSGVSIRHPGKRLEGIDLDLVPRGSIRGRVTDAASGAPLEGIRVHFLAFEYGYLGRGLAERWALTDADGYYLLPDVAPASYNAEALGKQGYAFSSWLYPRVRGGEARSGVDFQLAKGGRLIVEVRGAGGEALDSARLGIRGHGRLFLPARRIASGIHVFEGLPPDTYVLDVSCRGYIRQRKGLEVSEAGEEISEKLVLERGLEMAGRVLDSQGQALAGAWVRVWCISSGDMTTRTDERGAFSFRGLEPTECSFHAVATGCTDQYRRIMVKPGMAELVFTMEAMEPGIEVDHSLCVAGVVKDDLGNPVSGLEIGVSQGDETWVKTDEQGRFRAEGFAEGGVELEVDQTHGIPMPEYLSVPAGVEELEITVYRFARIAGRVVDESGQPVPVFTLRCESHEDGVFHEGRFELTEVAPGDRRIEAFVEATGQWGEILVHLRPGAAMEDLLLTLKKSGSISGVVRDRATRKGLVDATVSLGKKGAYGWYEQTRTGPDGSYRFEKVRTGEYWVSASQPGHANDRRVDLQLEPGKEVVIELLLLRSGSIAGRITEEGRPLRGVEVYLCFGCSARSRRDGTYELKDVPSGTYSVRVRSTASWPWDKELCQTGIEIREGEHAVWNCDFAQGVTLGGVITVRGAPAVSGSLDLEPQGSEEGLSMSFHRPIEEQGRYQIRGIPDGRYLLRIETEDRESHYSSRHQREVEIQGKPLVLDICLDQGATAVLEGFVLRDGKPLGGVEVKLSGDDELRMQQESDASGFFRFTHLPGGEVVLECENDGDRMEARVDLAPDLTVHQDLHFRSGSGVIEGRVHLDGQPVQMRKSRLEYLGEASLRRIVKRGSYQGKRVRYGELASGRYLLNLKFDGPDGHTMKVDRIVEVGAGETARVDVSLLSSDGSVSCHVPRPESGEIRVMLCPPGQGTWRVGEAFKAGWTGTCIPLEEHLHDRYVAGCLPAGFHDVVALHIERGIVIAMERKSIVVEPGEVVAPELLEGR